MMLMPFSGGIRLEVAIAGGGTERSGLPQPMQKRLTSPDVTVSIKPNGGNTNPFEHSLHHFPPHLHRFVYGPRGNSRRVPANVRILLK